MRYDIIKKYVQLKDMTLLDNGPNRTLANIDTEMTKIYKELLVLQCKEKNATDFIR